MKLSYTQCNKIKKGFIAKMGEIFRGWHHKEAAKIINAMAHNGRYIIYGALSHDDIAVPVFPILGKHLTVRGYELFEITTVPEKLAKAKKFVFDGLASGQLQPEIDKVFAFDEMIEAHHYLESNQQIGKILVKL